MNHADKRRAIARQVLDELEGAAIPSLRRAMARVPERDWPSLNLNLHHDLAQLSVIVDRLRADLQHEPTHPQPQQEAHAHAH